MSKPNCVFSVLESVVKAKREVSLYTFAMTVIVLHKPIVVKIKVSFVYTVARNIVLEVLDVFAATLPAFDT
jgi:hypothetical protein